MTLPPSTWENFLIINDQTPVGFVEANQLYFLKPEERDKYAKYLKVYKDYFDAMKRVGLDGLEWRDESEIYNKWLEMGFNRGKKGFKTQKSFKDGMKYRRENMETLYNENKKREAEALAIFIQSNDGIDEIDRLIRVAHEEELESAGRNYEEQAEHAARSLVEAGNGQDEAQSLDTQPNDGIDEIDRFIRASREEELKSGGRNEEEAEEYARFLADSSAWI